MSDEEWGNLGDFDANDTHATVKANNKLRASDPKWLEATREGSKSRQNNADWYSNVSEANRKKATEFDWTEAGKKRSQSLKGKYTGKNAFNKRECKTPLGIFPSVIAAAKAHNLCKDTIRKRLKNNIEGYYYIDDKSA